MDRVLKNFYIYNDSSPNPINRWTWECPELVGIYEMKILLMTQGSIGFDAYQLTINSPQLITKNPNNYSLAPLGYYNPYNLPVDFINFINVGQTNNRRNRYICGDLTAIVNMNGRFDYQHLVFNTTWNSGGKSYLTFDYILNKKMVITAEFKKIKQQIQRPLLTDAVDRKHFILNITSPPSNYFTQLSNFSINDYRLKGRFRCKLIYNCCISDFPENVGCYLLSPQFDINTRYYFSIGGEQRRDNYGYPPTGYVGTFYGMFNFTVYSNRTQLIEPIQSSVFTWEFEELN
jgi:hypothetical protein